MAEVVTVHNAEDVRPYDQVDEGVFVESILFPGGRLTVGPCTWEDVGDDERGVVKSPVWGEMQDVWLTYPTTVVRGMEPPRAQ